MIFSFVGVLTREMLTLRRVSPGNPARTSPRTVLGVSWGLPNSLFALVFSIGADDF
jgi:hypothetical protein